MLPWILKFKEIHLGDTYIKDLPESSALFSPSSTNAFILCNRYVALLRQ